MRIAQIHTSDTGGGAEHLAVAVHRALRQAGHGSILYVGRKRTQEDHVVEIARPRGIPGLQRLSRWAENRWGLENLYQPGFRDLARAFSEDTDVVVVRGLTGAERFSDVGGLPAITRRFPTLLWMDEMWMMTGHCVFSLGCDRWTQACGKCPDLSIYPALPHDGTRFNFLRKQRILKRCELHVAGPSRYLIDQVATSPILQHLPRSVVRNGIDLDIFRPANRSLIRDELGLPAEPILVMLGANHLDSPYKPARHAVAAINLAARECELSAIVVGNRVAEIQRELAVRSWALPYTADRALLAKYYQAADIFVLPAIEETYGLMAAEAMACECCVVAYAAGALPELIDHNETGYLVERGNRVALGEALMALYASPDRIARLGLAAARRAKDDFGFEKHVSQLVALLQDLVAVRRRSAAVRPRASLISSHP
jgi:glycosyltransferase involved in cell wall biosynthesis